MTKNVIKEQPCGLDKHPHITEPSTHAINKEQLKLMPPKTPDGHLCNKLVCFVRKLK